MQMRCDVTAMAGSSLSYKDAQIAYHEKLNFDEDDENSQQIKINICVLEWGYCWQFLYHLEIHFHGIAIFVHQSDLKTFINFVIFIILIIMGSKTVP